MRVWPRGRRSPRRCSALRLSIKPRSNGTTTSTVRSSSAHASLTVPVGASEGLTLRQLGVIRDTATPLPSVSSPEPLTAFQAAALAFADASTREVYVPMPVLEALKVHLADDQQLLECAATTATYNMVSRLLVALDVGDHVDDACNIPEAPGVEHDVSIADGVTLHARVHKRVEDASAPWIVCVNSLMTSLEMWGQVVPALARRFNVVVYDQRGHGKVRVLG